MALRSLCGPVGFGIQAYMSLNQAFLSGWVSDWECLRDMVGVGITGDLIGGIGRLSTITTLTYLEAERSLTAMTSTEAMVLMVMVLMDMDLLVVHMDLPGRNIRLVQHARNLACILARSVDSTTVA